MASRYLEWLHRDVQPEVPRELTKQEKFYNWWDYHIWHVIAGGVLLAALACLAWHYFGARQAEPDYQIAYLGTEFLPADTVEALESALAALGEDCNGDGEVAVRLNQYTTGGDGGDRQVYAYAVSMRLTADLEDCGSYFFLLEDPEVFQAGTWALQPLDGSGRENAAAEECCLRWEDCPGAAGLDLGAYQDPHAGEGDSQDRLSGLYLARRGFWGKKTVDNPGECAALWDILTEGAVP